MLRQVSYKHLQCCSLLYCAEGPGDYASWGQLDGRESISSGLFLICLFHWAVPYLLTAPLDDLAACGGFDPAVALNNCFIIY